MFSKTTDVLIKAIEFIESGSMQKKRGDTLPHRYSGSVWVGPNQDSEILN